MRGEEEEKEEEVEEEEGGKEGGREGGGERRRARVSRVGPRGGASAGCASKWERGGACESGFGV